MAKATIRPDYMTGPAISEKMSGLATVIRAANRGIVIVGKFLFGKIDSMRFDRFRRQHRMADSPKPARRPLSNRLSSRGSPRSSFSQAIPRNPRQNWPQVWASFVRGNSSAASKRAYIEERQRAGHSVIYVGDCGKESAVAEQADVAISVLEAPYNKTSKGTIAFLSPDLIKILQLRAIAGDAIDEFKLGFRLSLAPNLAAVFGALFLASPTSVAVLLTNLGMLADYVRSGTILHRAETEEQD